jgi:hypothetical protein
MRRALRRAAHSLVHRKLGTDQQWHGDEETDMNISKPEQENEHQSFFDHHDSHCGDIPFPDRNGD